MNRTLCDWGRAALVLATAALAGCDRGEPTPDAGRAAPVQGIDPSMFVARGMVPEGILREASVKAPVRDVFAAMTTEAGVKRILLVDAHVDLRIGGPWELVFDAKADPGNRGTEGSTILSYVPNRMLSVAVSAPPSFPEERRKRTWIVVTFDPIGNDQTFVRLVHLGFGEGGRWDALKQSFEHSWTGAFNRLTEAFDPPKPPGTAPAQTPPR
jgi:uncharacterized protein YndB with AHSA1/START domain